MNIRASLLFIILLAMSSLVEAQQNSLKQLDVSLAAPEAAEIAKYGNLEVNMFKGVPDVTVPIHTLKVQDFTLPIYLSYDASGIKVDQIATNVGLGWSLHGGGQITVSAYGKDDFDEPVRDFVQNPDILENFDPNVWQSNGDTTGKADYDKAWEMYNPDFGGVYKNLKPDVFFYSYGGKNGKFVIDGDINDYFTHYTVPFRELDISYTSSIGFEIVDQNGHTYIFDELDTANLYNSPNDCYGGPGSGGLASPVPLDKILKDVRTWHLGQIITAGGEVINFNYDNSQTQFSYIATEIEQKYEQAVPTAGCQSSISDYQCLTKKTISPKRLSSIVHSNSGQKIEFVYSGTARQDFGNSTYTALDSIIVKRHGKELKAFDLENDSYFGSGSAMRLKLSGVTQEGYPSGYSFDYNTSVSLPERGNKGQDKWGFFNGHTGNQSLIPNHLVTGGGNRDIDTSKVGAWSLERIDYPTGGSTILNMEGIPTGGGLRVGSIYDLNGMGDTTGTRVFDYQYDNDGDFNYVDWYEYYLGDDYQDGSGPSCGYNMYTSSNVPPVNSMDNPDYGFTKVTVSYEVDGSQGKTEYHYSEGINDLSAASVTDPGALNWGRGELLKTIQFDAAGNKLAEQENTFKVHKTDTGLWGDPLKGNENYIYGVDIQLERAELNEGVGGEFNLNYKYPAKFKVEKFRVISAWYHPDSTYSRIYDPTDVTSVQTTHKKREYDSSSTQLRKVISTNSDGQVRETEYTYAAEQYPGMLQDNMETQPYQIVLKDGGGDTLRVDWILWKEFSTSAGTIWKPCGQWVGGPHLGTATPEHPNCN